MTQLDKLEILNSQWKAFAHCQNDNVKEYAKSVMMYMMSKGRITQLEKITANRHSIVLHIVKNTGRIEIFIYGENDCDILFYNDSNNIDALDKVNYFGLTEIIIEMYFYERMIESGSRWQLR